MHSVAAALVRRKERTSKSGTLTRVERRARIGWTLLSPRTRFVCAGLLMTLLSFGLSMLIAAELF